MSIIDDFIKQITKTGQQVGDQVQGQATDFMNSPVGALVQGKPDQFIPRTQNLIAGTSPQKWADMATSVVMPDSGGAGVGASIAKKAAPKANILTKMGNAIKSDVGKVQAPDAGSSLYGAEHTASIQDALTRHGVDNHAQLPNAARNLYDNIIHPELTSNPKIVSLDHVTNQIVTQMRKMSPGLDLVEAKNAAHSVINDLYDISRNKTGNSEPVPSHIDTPSLFNVRQDLNGTTAVDKYFKGTPPSTPQELAAVAGRNAISDIIAAAHPTIAQATKDYGLLKDAVSSLFDASKKGRAIGLNLPIGPMGTTLPVIPSFLGGPIRDAVGGTLRTAGKVADSPLGKGIGIAAGGAGLVGAGGLAQAAGLPQKLSDTLTGKASQNPGQQQPGSVANTNGNPSIQGNSIVTPTNSQSTDLSGITPDQNGDYQIPDTSAQTVVPGYISYQDKTSQINGLTQQLSDPANAIIPGQTDRIHQQIANVQKQYDDSQSAVKDYIAKKSLKPEIVSVLQDAPTANQVMNTLRHDLQQTPPGFLNAFKTIDQLKQYNNGQYAQLAAELEGIQAYAESLNPGSDKSKTMPGIGQSEAEALARLDVLQKKMVGIVQNNKDIYGLVATPIGGAPQNQYYGQTQYQPPANATAAPQLPPAPAGGNLPPIVPGLQLSPLNQQIGGATP